MKARVNVDAHSDIVYSLQTTTAISGMKFDTMRKHRSGRTKVTFVLVGK